MKTLIIRNNLKTKLDTRLSDVKKYFAPKREFEFTVIDKKFSYFDLQKDSINGYVVDRISDIWFDELISKPYKNYYDCVVLLVSKKDWKSGPIVQGYRTHNNLGIQEIVMLVNEVDGYNFMGKEYEGDQITWILKHELMHALCLKEGIIDNVHPYYIKGTPDKLIEELKPLDPMNKWKYFKATEKTGSLGHTVADLNPELVDKLDIVRGLCGFPFVITSGYRTIAENAQVGGVEGSAHTKKNAVDIACTDASKRMTIIGNAWNNGFIGIGIDKDFIHLDLDSSNKRRIWLY